jgi:hypothetical protein
MIEFVDTVIIGAAELLFQTGLSTHLTDALSAIAQNVPSFRLRIQFVSLSFLLALSCLLLCILL